MTGDALIIFENYPKIYIISEWHLCMLEVFLLFS